MKIENTKSLTEFTALEIFVAALAVLTAFTVMILRALTNINTGIESILTGWHTGNFQDLLYPLIFNVISVLCLFYLAYVVYSVVDIIYCRFISKKVLLNKADVNYDFKDLIFKGLSWKFYRILGIVKFPAFVILAGAALIIFFLVFFNFLMAMAGYSLFLTSFVFIFTIFTVVFSFLIALFISIWIYLISGSGFECAIAEPELSNFLIKKRSERLVFANPCNIIVSVAGILYFVGLCCQIFQIMGMPDFISWENSGWVSAFIVLNFLALAFLKDMKVRVYSNSLLVHYKNITLDSSRYYGKFNHNLKDHA